MLRARVTSSGGGAVAAARAGLDQGMCCLACCGALMAVLLAVGIMNLAWMAALTAVCFAEKNSRHGGVVTTTTGLALLALGAAVLLHPQLLTTLAPSPMAMGPMTR
jgi:predicted metal-binding membrane protein